MSSRARNTLHSATLLAAVLLAGPALAQTAEQEQIFSTEMARGVAALEAGDPAAAVTAFRAALQAAPGHPEARTFLGTALLEGGNPSGAIDQLLPVARDFPDIYAARMNLARAYLAADREAAALPELLAAVRLRPEDHGSRARAATLLMRFGRLDEASAHAQELATRLPDSIAVQSLVGTVELERADYAAALAAFDRVVASRSEDPVALYGRAAALRGLGRDREAIQILGNLVNTNPEHADAWLLFGDILAGGADIESKIAAVDVYRSALELRPEDERLLQSLTLLYASAGLDDEIIALLETSPTTRRSEPLSLALGRSLFQLERLDDALAAYQQATRFESAEAWYRVGITQVNLAALEAAETAYREALELAPDHSAAKRELGNVLLERGDLPGARAALADALVDLPDDPRTNYLAGLTALRSSDPDGALPYLRRTLELEPNNTDALYNLGLALRDSGDIDAGRDTLAQAQQARRSVDAGTDSPAAGAAEAARRDGYLRYRIGSAGSAVAILTRATELDPTDEFGWFYLGLSHAELGQNADAIVALEAAAAIRDDRAETWEVLTDLYAREGRNDDAERALRRFESLSTEGAQ